MTLHEAHILLVDDEPALLLTCGALLRREGARVTQAANGADALRLAQDRTFDLLMTDLHMPVMDGLALLHALAAQGRTLPTILCAGHIADADDPELASLGVVATLLKPFTPAVLAEMLQRALLPLPRR